MNLTWRRKTPETSSFSLPISHISSNIGALLVAIRLVWSQYSCDVLLLGSYSHFQCCMGSTLGPGTAWFTVQISSLHVHTLWMVFLPGVNFMDNIRPTLTNQEKTFPLQEQSLTVGIPGTAHQCPWQQLSCSGWQANAFLHYWIFNILNPTPPSLQTVVWMLCLSTFICAIAPWLAVLAVLVATVPTADSWMLLTLISSPRTFQYVLGIHLRSQCIVSRFH